MAPLHGRQGRILKSAHAIAFLSLFSVPAAQVADFAPLEVGNTWTYQGSISRFDNGRYSWNSVRRSVKVLSRTDTGGTTVHRLSVRDSLHDRRDSTGSGSGVRHLPDTLSDTTYSLIESGDTLVSGLQDFFFRRSVPDSLKSREVTTSKGALTITERMKGPISIGGEPRWVFERRTHRLLGMGEARADSSIFAQNLGAVLVGGGGGRSGYYTFSGRYRLVEFNGDSVDYVHVPGTSLLPRIRVIVPAAAKKSGPVLLFQGNRDGLGRLGPFVREYPQARNSSP